MSRYLWKRYHPSEKRTIPDVDLSPKEKKLLLIFCTLSLFVGSPRASGPPIKPLAPEEIDSPKKQLTRSGSRRWISTENVTPLSSTLSRRTVFVLYEAVLIPAHQFVFNHWTTEQCHRLVERIVKAFEKKEYCCAVLMDVKQPFDRIWHHGLHIKIKSHLPSSPFALLTISRNFPVATYSDDNAFLASAKDPRKHQQ